MSYENYSQTLSPFASIAVQTPARKKDANSFRFQNFRSHEDGPDSPDTPSSADTLTVQVSSTSQDENSKPVKPKPQTNALQKLHHEVAPPRTPTRGRGRDSKMRFSFIISNEDAQGSRTASRSSARPSILSVEEESVYFDAEEGASFIEQTGSMTYAPGHQMSRGHVDDGDQKRIGTGKSSFTTRLPERLSARRGTSATKTTTPSPVYQRGQDEDDEDDMDDTTHTITPSHSHKDTSTAPPAPILHFDPEKGEYVTPTLTTKESDHNDDDDDEEDDDAYDDTSYLSSTATSSTASSPSLYSPTDGDLVVRSFASPTSTPSSSSQRTRLPCTPAMPADTQRLKTAALALMRYSQSEDIYSTLLNRLQRMIRVEDEVSAREGRAPVSVARLAHRLKVWLEQIEGGRVVMGEDGRIVRHEGEWAGWIAEAARTGVLHVKGRGCRCRGEWRR